MGILWCLGAGCQTTPPPTALTCEGEIAPMGLVVPNPRLAWESTVDSLTAIQVQVAHSPEALSHHQPTIWDSGKRQMSQSHLTYEGPSFPSNRKFYWRVRVWDQQDRESAFSKIAVFETGLLDSLHWPASLPDSLLNRMPLDSAYFTTQYFLDRELRKGRLFVKGVQHSSLSIHGKFVGRHTQDTAFQQTYAVTRFLRWGENPIVFRAYGLDTTFQFRWVWEDTNGRSDTLDWNHLWQIQ